MPATRQSTTGKTHPKMTIVRNDTVLVLSGKDKGKRGRVTRVLPQENRVVVEGVNMVKRHMRRQPNSLQAGIIDMPAPLNRSKVMLVCPNCDRPTRVAHAILPNGDHERRCKNCEEIIESRAKEP